MTRSYFRRFLTRETAVGVVVSTLLSTVPGLLFDTVPHPPAVQAVRAVAMELTPQFFINGLMSALVPSLRLWWTNAARKNGNGLPIHVHRIAVIALLSAGGSTVVTLALIHLCVILLEPVGLDAGAILRLRATEAALTAAAVTPLALALLARGFVDR